MFGAGISKLFLLGLIVMAVWYGFKLVGRLDRQRKRMAAEENKRARDSIERMDQCPVCGIYVVADQAANCGRADCPY